MRYHFKPLCFQVIQRLSVGFELNAFRPLYVEHRNVKMARSSNLRILLPQGSSRGVPGICKQGFPPALPFLVQCMEHLLGHIDLTADDQTAHAVLNTQRDGFDGPQIFGYILPHLPVTPGSPPDKQAVPILQRHRQAVHLGFGHIGGILNRFPYPFIKGAHLIKIKYILKRFQRNPVSYRRKGGYRLAAHPLGR